MDKAGTGWMIRVSYVYASQVGDSGVRGRPDSKDRRGDKNIGELHSNIMG